MSTEYEPLDWDLDERDRLLESGELTRDIPDPAQVAVGEDE